MYFVYYEGDYQYDNIYGMNTYQHVADVEAFINKNPNYKYTVIEGQEKQIIPVTTVTKLELK